MLLCEGNAFHRRHGPARVLGRALHGYRLIFNGSTILCSPNLTRSLTLNEIQGRGYDEPGYPAGRRGFMDLRGAQCVLAAEDAALEGDDGGMAVRLSWTSDVRSSAERVGEADQGPDKAHGQPARRQRRTTTAPQINTGSRFPF